MSLLTTLAAATQTPARPDRPPVPYTADTGGGEVAFGAGGDLRQQLAVTPGESTLMSVLTLISQTVGTNEWTATRPQVPGQRQEKDPVPVTAAENLAVALWHQPNTFMTGTFMRTMCTWHRAAVGEAWIVVQKVGTIPVALWPVRPDRMFPMHDPGKYLTGYKYVGPDGGQVPLDLDEVLRITFPHPMDPHRGLGPVPSLLTTLGTSMSAQAWIQAFFRNDASPGGIIELGSEPGDSMEEHEFTSLKRRWNEQHRGYSRAHRVAILEYGKWVPRQMSIKDMQFTEVRTLSRDQILEAFRIHKHMMGISEDVNLANATAADTTYGKRTDNPLLKEWKSLANGPYRDMFGTPGQLVEFGFDDPVPANKIEEREEHGARVDNAVKLIGTGKFEPASVLEEMGLPPIKVIEVTAPPAAEPAPKKDPAAPAEHDAPAGLGTAMDIAQVTQKLYLGVKGNALMDNDEGRDVLRMVGAPLKDGPLPEDDLPEKTSGDPMPAVMPPAPGSGGGGQPAGAPALEGEDAPAARVPGATGDRAGHPMRAQTGPASTVDLSQLDAQWRAKVEEVLGSWQGITDAQYAALIEQVRAAIDSGSIGELAALQAPDEGGTSLLTDAMVLMALAGAHAVAGEAAAQGITTAVSAVVPTRSELEAYATVVTQLMRTAVSTSAGREALRVWGPGVSTEDVLTAVRAHLDQLTDAQPRRYLGGALTSAVNAGRMHTMEHAPTARYFASEQLDANTCPPCREIDQTEFGDLETARSAYPFGAYRKCQGREWCRGLVVAIWDAGEG
jgi:HK97 family phage portal protein